jgi:carbamoylphosphate synthase small subunit
MALYRLVKSFRRSDMKGLNLLPKFPTKEPYFYGDEHGNHNKVLDFGIKRNILRNLLKETI